MITTFIALLIKYKISEQRKYLLNINPVQFKNLFYNYHFKECEIFLTRHDNSYCALTQEWRIYLCALNIFFCYKFNRAIDASCYVIICIVMRRRTCKRSLIPSRRKKDEDKNLFAPATAFSRSKHGIFYGNISLITNRQQQRCH